MIVVKWSMECVFQMIKFYTPILCNFISGFQTISSSLRWRPISSSYSTIVFWKTPHISSTTAVSLSLTNSLKQSTEDIVVQFQVFQIFIRTSSSNIYSSLALRALLLLLLLSLFIFLWRLANNIMAHYRHQLVRSVARDYSYTLKLNKNNF